jgi:hypothetical protein
MGTTERCLRPDSVAAIPQQQSKSSSRLWVTLRIKASQ